MRSRSHDPETEPVNGRGVGRPRRSAWLSRVAAAGLCITSIGFVVTVGFAVASHGQMALVTRPPSMRIALAFPPIVLGFAICTLIGAVLGWSNRYWSLAARVHQTILALCGLGFVWQLAALGFLG